MTIPGKRTVLIVDDESSIRESLERLIRSGGYETVMAAHGQEALARAAAQEFEVVIMDIRMPGLSGIDVLRKMNTEYQDTSVIMISALADVGTAVEAMKLGAYDYITKPFNLDDILMRVEKARERRHLKLQVRDYQKNLEERVAEQAKELRQMMTQTVHALINESAMAQQMETGGRGRKQLSSPNDISHLQMTSRSSAERYYGTSAITSPEHRGTRHGLQGVSVSKGDAFGSGKR